MAYLQLFSDWLIYVFHYFTCNEWGSQLLQTYVIKILFWDDSNGDTRFMLRFKITAIRISFYVKSIKMCIHPQRVRISTFSNISFKNTFLRFSSGANQINAAIQNGHCKQFIFEIIIYSKAGGASCAITCFSMFHKIESIFFTYF